MSPDTSCVKRGPATVMMELGLTDPFGWSTTGTFPRDGKFGFLLVLATHQDTRIRNRGAADGTQLQKRTQRKVLCAQFAKKDSLLTPIHLVQIRSHPAGFA